MSQFHKYSFVSPWNFRWEIETARKLLQNPQLPRCPWKSILWLIKKTMASHTGPYLFTDSYKYVFCSNADGEVIERRRSCTDVLCLLIFVAFLVAWAGLGVFAVSKGDISRFVFL